DWSSDVCSSDLHQVLVQLDGVAFLDVPLDDGRGGQAFAKVGQEEFLAHVPFPVERSHAPLRCPKPSMARLYVCWRARLAAATILPTLGRYFIRRRSSGTGVACARPRSTGAA